MKARASSTLADASGLRYFVDALRDVIDLDPLYFRGERTTEERFYRVNPGPLDDGRTRPPP